MNIKIGVFIEVIYNVILNLTRFIFIGTMFKTSKLINFLFILCFSIGANAISLKCDGVETYDMRGDEKPGTFSETFTKFMNLKPDQNETFMDDDTKVSIQWSDSSVTIKRENLWFPRNDAGDYVDTYFISRKDFTWAGMRRYQGLRFFKGTCKLWEKPKDNAF